MKTERLTAGLPLALILSSILLLGLPACNGGVDETPGYDDPIDYDDDGDNQMTIMPDQSWFTCSVAPRCVEYLIDDPEDRADFIRRCANYTPGRACAPGRSCTQTAPGRTSVSYGGNVSDAEFRSACINDGGTPQS